MSKILNCYVFCCAVIIALCATIKHKHIKHEIYTPFLIAKTKNSSYDANLPLIATQSLLPNKEISAHASAIVAKDSKLMTLFYAGSREGAEDVKIYQSFLDITPSNKDSKWSDPLVLLTPEMLTKVSGRYLKKLGNPIVFKDSKGKIHLFVVGVSLGGWATSRIYQFYFSDDLTQIHFIRELHLNPFGNYSHLVRTPALPLKDGGFMLAFSHEMWHKFPLIAIFDKNAKMLSTQTINHLKAQLQPSIVALNEKECAAFYRTNNRYNTNTYYQTCTDYAKTWHDVETSNMKNYDSSILLVNVGDEIILITNDGKHNPMWGDSVKKGDRQSLSLYYLQDKIRGQFVYIDTIDTAKKSGEVSYPAAVLNDNLLHVTYTYNRKTIKHTALNTQAILQRINSIKKDSMQHNTKKESK